MFIAEIFGATLAIEIAHQRGWLNLWVETDSMLLLQAFNNYNMIPWEVRSRWHNCVEITKGMHFVVNHILMEGNVCVDGLANSGLDNTGFRWWYDAPKSNRHDVN
jgi:ribonuclease HI